LLPVAAAEAAAAASCYFWTPPPPPLHVYRISCSAKHLVNKENALRPAQSHTPVLRDWKR